MGRVPLLALPLLLVAGCSGGLGSSGSPASQIVGKWIVDPEFAKQAQAGAQSGFMTGFSTTFHYEYKADKTFVGAMTGGTYSMDGPNLTMLTTTLNGQDIDKLNGAAHKVTMTGVLSPDGKSLTLQLPPLSLTLMPATLKQGIKMVRSN